MKAARFFGPSDIRVIETDAPTIGDHEVLLKVHVCGICGGDCRSYLDIRPQQPESPGHEIGAEVCEVGAAVEGLCTGDAVAVEPWTYCGECEECRKGETNHCATRQFMSYHLPGGMSEYIAAPAHVIHKMPAGTSYEQCALVEPLSVGIHTLRRCRLAPDETLVVLGLGSIGLAAIAAARHLGAARTIASAKYPHQAAVAEKLGADVVVGAGEEDIVEAVRSHTRRGADLVVVGSRGVPIELALEVVKQGGRMALLVAPLEIAPEKLGRAVSQEATLIGCDAYAAMEGKRDYEVAIEALLSGTTEFESIVTHRFPLARVTEAFEAAANRAEGAVKVLVTVS